MVGGEGQEPLRLGVGDALPPEAGQDGAAVWAGPGLAPDGYDLDDAGVGGGDDDGAAAAVVLGGEAFGCVQGCGLAGFGGVLKVACDGGFCGCRRPGSRGSL